jgi:hypothetical protein
MLVREDAAVRAAPRRRRGQLRAKSKLTRVCIASADAACNGALRDEIERVGLPRDRVESVVRPEMRFVHFEVAAWDGATCPTGAKC